MSNNNDNYEIRLATKDDIHNIMKYIGEDWKAGHILSVDRKLFEYEFLEPNGNVNMVIAINLDKNKIDGCLGFLKASINADVFDVWGCVWKVRKGTRNLLGLEILDYLRNIPQIRHFFGIGMNPSTSLKIHKDLLKENAAKMKHWYYLADRGDYALAVVSHRENENICAPGDISVKRVDIETFNFQFEKVQADSTYFPHKNKEYYKRRFFEHCTYNYNVWGIYLKDTPKAFIFSREDTFNNRKALRFVDYYGDEEYLYGMKMIADVAFEDNRFEYADFYEYGFSEENMSNSGFCLLKEQDVNIIPNYFHPFLRENIDIFVTFPIEKAKFVKGDGDQDRPN